MRELVTGPRGSGRTTTLIMTMVEEMDMHEDKVYVVVGRYCLGHDIKRLVTHLNGDQSRVRAVSLESLYTLSGVDPRNVYIEHTAYENATADQLSALFILEDAKDSIIWRNE